MSASLLPESGHGSNRVACPTRAMSRIAIASLRLDAGRLDDRPPLLNFCFVVRGKRLRGLLAPRPDSLTHVGESLLHRRIGERLDERGVELCDHLPGRSLRGPKSVPERRV